MLFKMESPKQNNYSTMKCWTFQGTIVFDFLILKLNFIKNIKNLLIVK
jgi:hypothetical protein